MTGQARKIATWRGNASALSIFLVLLFVAGCAWDPSRPFDRDAPQVKEALVDLDGGDAAAAAGRLEDYLSTGACKDGIIGTPDQLRRRADGTFDLGLSLFRIGEQYGRRFGEEEEDASGSEAARAKRHAQIECARRILQALVADESLPGELRARALYLEGNLAFLDGVYEDAVRLYDRALVLVPGEPDGGDPVGRDAAYNRAIALRRIDDKKKDAGSDASQDAAGDASRPSDAGRDSGQDSPKDSGGSDGAGPGQDAGADAEAPPPPPPPDAGEPPPPREAGASPPPSTDEDQRMLDQLENAPTLQQEEAKRFGKKRVRGMADK
jgi:tetratricopeptide (TPR) repeat protein